MAKIKLSESAVRAIRSWLEKTTMKDPIPWISWATVRKQNEKKEGWSIVLCPQAENLKLAIRNIDGVEMVVSESFIERNIKEFRIDYKDGQFLYNGQVGV